MKWSRLNQIRILIECRKSFYFSAWIWKVSQVAPVNKSWCNVVRSRNAFITPVSIRSFFLLSFQQSLWVIRNFLFYAWSAVILEYKGILFFILWLDYYSLGNTGWILWKNIRTFFRVLFKFYELGAGNWPRWPLYSLLSLLLFM